MEALTSQNGTKQPQSQSQAPADDWSFLDGALDWEALLDEPVLETVMEDAALELSPHAASGTTDSQRSQVRAAHRLGVTAALSNCFVRDAAQGPRRSEQTRWTYG